MTFKDQPLNSMNFQAWKMKCLNSMIFQVFHDMYKPCCPKGKPPGTKGWTVQWVEKFENFPHRWGNLTWKSTLSKKKTLDIHLIDGTFLCLVDAWPGYQNLAHLWPVLLLIQLCKLGTSGLDFATRGVTNATSFYSVATKFSCLVANLAPKMGDFLLWENVH